jgi:predicted dehydrogenase
MKKISTYWGFQLGIPSDYLQEVEAGEVSSVFYKHLVGPQLFVDAILRDYMPPLSFEQGFKVQQVLDAAIESHQTGRLVQIKS